MVGKNNTQERFRRNATKDKRYTLKKLSVGLASVALGTILFLNGAETVSAEAEVVDLNTLAEQPVQETFHFNYLNQATGARLDGFFGDYVNTNEAEKAFRHYANEQGYTLLNVRLEGHTFTADIAVEQDVQPEVEQEVQPAESAFQFIYRDKETGEKFDSFFGDYLNASEAEKDFRHYANQHGYTLSNIRKNGQIFTADVVRHEQSGTTDSDRYVEAAKQRAHHLVNALDNLTAEQKAEYLAQVEAAESVAQIEAVYDEAKNVVNEVEKDYSYTLNFGDRTESANLGDFDSEEQAELALRILANEKGYKLSNLRLEGRTFIADAKVEAEQDQSSEQTNRYLQEAKKRAHGIINGLENLFDTQKPSYLERIEDADSVAAVEAIVEEAQNYVNEGKGGENGQATEEPEKPEYNPEQNLVTYDIQITDHNGKTQTQRVTFPSRELALNYISQLVRSYEKAGVVLNEERSDVEGKDNTFILVFEEKQAEEPAKADYTVKVIVDGEERQSQALPDTTRQGAIDYAKRLAKSYEQDGFTYNHLDTGLPSDTVVRIELSSPKLDIPSHTEDAPAPTPELDPEEEAGRELDAVKAGALEDIANLDYFTADEKQDLVDRINDYDNTGDIDFIVSKAIEENDARHKVAEALKAHKEKAIKDLKTQGFDNDFVFGLIDKANTKEGVDALVANIDLDELNKLNNEFGQLEQKAKNLNNQLEGLINEVEGKEEVTQEDFDAILNKVNEIRENLDKMQKHINILPSEERENAQAELNQVKELLDKVEEQYSYESPLQELKNEVISDLLTKGASTELLNEIQNAPSAQVVRQLAGEFERQKEIKEISERTSSLKTTIETEVTHDGQKSKLLEELKEAKTLPQLEKLEAKVDRQIAVDRKRAEAVEIKNKWEKLYFELEEDSEGNKFTTEAQYSELLNLSSQYNQLLPEWEKLAQGDYTNESGVQAFKDIVKDRFNKIPPVINIGELGDSVELKIKALVSDSTKKEEFKNKLTSANTVKELQELEKEVDQYLDDQDKTELEKERSQALENIEELITEESVAKHQVVSQKTAVNNAESVEDIYKAVAEAYQIAFDNYKTGTVENVEEDKELSQALKDKYVPLLKEATTGAELDKVLSLLDVEEFVEKAEKAGGEAEKALEGAQKNGEFTVHDQSVVKAANDKVGSDKAEAQKLLDGLSEQYAEELIDNEELKASVTGLQDRLNKVNKVDVPEVSEEILDGFKDGAKEALKNLTSNLTDAEREVYEKIIDKMDAKDNAGNNVDEIVQVAIAEDQYKQIEAENNPAEKEKFKKRAQGALNFVEGTSEDEEDYPEYKQDLLKEKKRVQDLLNG